MTRGRFVDLTGRRYGAWLVLERVPSDSRRVMYLCRCDCGREVRVQAGNLRTGRSTKCRLCSVRSRVRPGPVAPKPAKVPQPKGPPIKDLTGRKFGEWTVLYYVGPTPSRQHLWKCKCSCGVRALVQAGNLRSGRSTRCRGCGSGHK